MDSRFEDDMIELAGGGSYLMLCRDRKTLFLEGAAEGRVALGDIEAFACEGNSIVVKLAEGTQHAQPFPDAAEAQVQEAAAKLQQAAAKWRGGGD